MTNKWIDDFTKKLGVELSTMLKLGAHTAHKLNQDFIAQIAHLNTLCAKSAIVVLCASAIGIIDVRHIVALFVEPTTLAVLCVLAALFSLSSFGAGLLVVSGLQQGLIQSKRGAAHLGSAAGSKCEKRLTS